MSLEPWQQRVVEEKEALDEKIIKLNVYISNPDNKVDGLLEQQLDHMFTYSDILTARIAQWSTPA